MRKPFDKTFQNVAATSIHPYSQIKAVQKQYHMDGSGSSNERDVLMYRSDFKSSLPQHPAHEKYTNYVSEYSGKYPTA